MKNNHALYGDDDQERLLSLLDQEEEIQKLVDISNRQVMKERLKDVTKKKAVIDTTINAVKPEEFPEDIEVSKPEKKKKNKEEKQKEPKKKKEKKTLNANGVKNVIKIFILLVLVLIVFQFRTEIVDTGKKVVSGVAGLVSSKTNNETNNTPEQVQPQPGSESTPNNGENVEGYMENASSKDYTLKEVLNVSTEANATLQKYYNSLVEIATESKSSNVADKIKTNSEMIQQDRSALETYADKFSEYEMGENYYNSLIRRFDHLQNLIDEISWVETSKIYAYINRAIVEENELIAQGKNDLMSFLDANGIQYTVGDTSITYEIN